MVHGEGISNIVQMEDEEVSKMAEIRGLKDEVGWKMEEQALRY